MGVIEEWLRIQQKGACLQFGSLTYTSYRGCSHQVSCVIRKSSQGTLWVSKGPNSPQADSTDQAGRICSLAGNAIPRLILNQTFNTILTKSSTVLSLFKGPSAYIELAVVIRWLWIVIYSNTARLYRQLRKSVIYSATNH